MDELPKNDRLGAQTGSSRRALIIGISNYSNLPKHAQLRTPVNDAMSMKLTLQELGFDVQIGTDLKYHDMLDMIQDFGSRIKDSDVAFFFFAGHGVAIAGQNFLLPADMPQDGEEWRVSKSACRASDVIEYLRDRAKLVVAVLDAGRNNPFENSFERPTQSLLAPGGSNPFERPNRGLVPMADSPNGTFIMFSDRAGSAPLDRLNDGDPDPNSVFTRVLLKHLKQRNLSLAKLAHTVRDEVHKLASEVGHEQSPAFWDEFSGSYKFYLAGAAPQHE